MSTTRNIGATLLLLAGIAVSETGMAQGACGEIEFGNAITSRFPNAADSCLGVVERDGEQYAHFAARVQRVRGNTVDVEFRRPDGSYGQPVSFTPSAEARVRIGGRSYRYRDLTRDQELDVYVPPDLWAFAVTEDPLRDFEEADSVQTVALTEPTTQVASLPSTATRMPQAGLVGVMLLVLGAGLAVFRRQVGLQR